LCIPSKLEPKAFTLYGAGARRRAKPRVSQDAVAACIVSEENGAFYRVFNVAGVLFRYGLAFCWMTRPRTPTRPGSPFVA